MSIHEEFRSSGFFVVRTPLVPFAQWEHLSAGSRAAEVALVSPETLREALDHDRTLLRTRLSDWIRSPEILDALFVASPSLVENLHYWLEGPDSAKGARVERSLIKYFARMAARCTPFGLFSGCTVGELGAETRLELAPHSAYERCTRPDIGFLAALVDALNRDPAVRQVLRFRPNSSLYRIADRAQYVAARQEQGVRTYILMSASVDEAFSSTLDRANGGASIRDLVENLVAAEFETEDAEAYVQQLIDAQILISELALGVTGAECSDDLVQQLDMRANLAPSHQRLVGMLDSLQKLDSAGLGAPPARYRDIAAALHGMPVEPDITRLFQVNLMKPAVTMQIPASVVDHFVEGARALQALFAAVLNDGLDDFRVAFRERYEDREVALVEALDEEIGVGFRVDKGPGSETSPILQAIWLDEKPEEYSFKLTNTLQLLQRRLVETLAAGHREMVLAEEDLEFVQRPGEKPLPDGFEIVGSVLPPARNPDGSVQQRVLVTYLAGPSGARLFGRFCHSDPDLREHVERHLAAEEALRPDQTFFEVVHLPEGRVGNIICRPVFRKYELPYLGRSGAAAERQIDVGDLTVSLHGERIVLRSRSLNRELIPRLTNAHNVELRSVGLYRFLAALQKQGTIPGLTWNWGVLNWLPFLPRVRFAGAILFRATWRMSAEEIRGLSRGSDVERFRAVQEWRRRHTLPRHVAIAEGLDDLCIDLDNCASVDVFVQAIERRSEVFVREMLPAPEDLMVQAPEGKYCHEIILPFVRHPTSFIAVEPSRPALTAAQPLGAPEPIVPRLRAPGSDWLYLKIFCGPAVADRILIEVLVPLVQEVIARELVHKWFFLRYAEPAVHLRVRFQGVPDKLVSIILPLAEAALRPYLSSGLIWKVQLDTYEPELRRYGGAWSMELCEGAFHADSDAVIEILAALASDGTGDERWRLALAGIDALLDDFGFDLQHKFLLIRARAKVSAEAYGLMGRRRNQLQAKYRKEHRLIEALMSGSPNTELQRRGNLALRRRSARLHPLGVALAEQAAQGKLNRPRHEIVLSLAHMHANRMLRGNIRAQEAILYQFLDHHYDSQLARLGIKGSQRELIRPPL